MLTLALTWPDDLPLTREALNEKLAETLYKPDVAMLTPVEGGEAGVLEWGDGTTGTWAIEANGEEN